MRETRGDASKVEVDAARLPARPFLYTIDQLSTLLELSEHTLTSQHIYFVGRSVGMAPRSLMKAVDMSKPGNTPDWRVVDREFIRWMRFKGFKYYDSGAFGA